MVKCDLLLLHRYVHFECISELIKCFVLDLLLHDELRNLFVERSNFMFLEILINRDQLAVHGETVHCSWSCDGSQKLLDVSVGAEENLKFLAYC